MAQRPFSWFIILGNHESYSRIYSEFPLEYSEKVKGMVRRPRANIYIAETGEIYEIAGKKVLAINGAPSHDIQAGILDPTEPDWKEKAKELDRRRACYRVLNISWWPEEIPDDTQRRHVEENVKKYEGEIDYIFSHDCPSEMCYAMKYWPSEIHEFNKWLQTMWNSFDNSKVKWYFGHHHQNYSYERFTCLYEVVERIA